MIALDLITDFIRLNFFFSFGVYSIFEFINKKKLVEFDKIATDSIPFWGIIWFALTLINFVVFKETPHEHIIPVLLITVLPFILSQLFRKSKFRRKIFLRLFLGIVFLLSYEFIDIIMIVLSRGSVPDTWINFNVTPIELFALSLINIAMKIIIFVGFVYTFRFLKPSIKL